MPDPVLSPGENGAWDDGGFSEAEVLYYNGLFHIFYGGAKMEPGNEDCDTPGNTRANVKESIGYAYSYDGINFIKYQENPVIDRQDIKHHPKVGALAEVHFEIEMPYIYIVSTQRWEDDWEGDVALRVTDDDGDSDTAMAHVVISNATPIVEAGPGQTANEGQEVPFSGSLTDLGRLDTHTTTIN